MNRIDGPCLVVTRRLGDKRLGPLNDIVIELPAGFYLPSVARNWHYTPYEGKNYVCVDGRWTWVHVRRGKIIRDLGPDWEKGT